MTFGRPAARPTADPYLVVENLTVQFPTHDGLVQAVSDLSYTVRSGQTLGIVGESGSGKSVSSMAVLGLHDPQSTRLSGSIRVGGQEVVGADKDTLRAMRGNDVAMIFQDPLTALHPFYSIGKQIAEAVRMHNNVSKADARRRAVEMLDRVGIPQASNRVDDYPHQFSGGMRQRAMIAMALVNNPKLLIADEPTTALDVTVQAQILDLLQDLQARVRLRDRADHPRPRRHRRDRRRRAGDVRRPRGRERPDQVDPHPARDALHLGAAEQRARHLRRHHRAADPDPRDPPSLLNPPDGLRRSTHAARTWTRCPATCAGPRCPS